jgi:lysyl-tRNA synthetase, class II
MTIPFLEDNDQTLARKEHLAKLRELVGNVYPNKFSRTNISGVEDTISNILAFEPIASLVDKIKEHIKTLNEGERPNPELKEGLNAELKALGNVRISGRLATPPRTMGKAAFVHLSDGKNRLQVYIRRDDIVGIYNGIKPQRHGDTEEEFQSKSNPKSEIPNPQSPNGWEMFKLCDHGDFIGVEGFLFITNTGELSVHVETLQFLSKAMLPMPDKIHGIADPEIQRRYRYADLIADSLKVEHEALTTREVFEIRARVISGMRRFLDDDGYIEVETPMLTPKATGAAARPFATHHNALDIPLYARIAPELYLKRLTVGGFEKVYELNRNFRNEGISQRHNPEFTMLEFYCAYMDVNGMMDFCEKLLQESVLKTTGSLKVTFGENEVDFGKFERLTMRDAVSFYWNKEQKLLTGEEFNEGWFEKSGISNRILKFLHDFHIYEAKTRFRCMQELDEIQRLNNPIENSESVETEKIEEMERGLLVTGRNMWAKLIYEDESLDNHFNDTSENARNLEKLFEEIVEENLIQPTFIIDYPKSISPLSKASPDNPNIAERFELFINGMECANGFSELNDPQEQYERFLDQGNAREKGDDEAMVMDEDYIRALSYGMPPAAGIGIGIDRLVMLLTNRQSIRDVILFPHMRPVVKAQDEKVEE